MTSIAFGGENTGWQFGNNYGTVNISSDRPENPQRREDNDAEILRSLAFPQMLDRRDNIEPRHTNTCQWILTLDEYQSWKNQPCALLWIKGKPGAGKSTLMAFLHNRLQSQDCSPVEIRLEFFFSARGTKLQQTPLGMFRSLLNQLFHHDAAIRPQLREAYEQRCRQLGSGEWEWPQVVLEELLERLLLSSANQRHVTVFVDALDEAGAESARQLASYFHKLIDHAERKKLALQVCISCRHYPIVASTQGIEIRVEDHNQGDIASYINHMLVDAGAADGSSQEALVKELTRHANGMFQWAHIMLPLIKERLLEGELIDDIRSWLREVPAGLEDLYSHILNNVIASRNRNQSLLFFQWVCFAEQPLTVREIRYALAAQNAQITPNMEWEKTDGFIESDERMKLRVKALTGGLAEVISDSDDNSKPEVVQLVHQSVNDFLHTKGLALLLPSLSASSLSTRATRIAFQCHARLYQSCLTYVVAVCSNEKIGWDFKLGPLADDNNLKMIRVRGLAEQYPLLHYAIINLFVHAENAGEARNEFLQNEIDILEQIIAFWAWIYTDIGGREFSETGTHLLHVAAAANLVDLIEPLLSGGEGIESEDEYGNTALHFAARAGHTMVGKILRERGADCEKENEDGATPFLEAVRFGNLGFVEWLLDEDAGRAAEDGDALQTASLNGQNEILKILLAAGAKVNTQFGVHGNALRAAIYGGNVETVKILLDAHADVNVQGGRHGTCLQAAVCTGSYKKVKILLDAYADVNTQGGQYGNALQAAVYRGSYDIVNILLDAHADVNAQGGPYGNALQAAVCRRNDDMVKILLDAHADVNAQGGPYGNALQAAAYTGNTHTVKILLDAHADVNAQGGPYGSSLSAAIHSGHADAAEVFRHADADIAITDELDRTLLHIAASKDMSCTFRFTHLASIVNRRSRLLETPLHLAIYFGHVSFALKLLEIGADPSLPDGYGRNALDWAHGHVALTQKIRVKYPELALTPYETQELTVIRSLSQLADIIPQLTHLFPALQQIGRYLLFLKDTNKARDFLQVPMSRGGQFAHQATCDLCGIYIMTTRFVCKVCAHMDICSSCVKSHPLHSKLHPSQSHELFEVPGLPENNSQLREQESEQLEFLLNNLVHGNIVESTCQPGIIQPGIESTNDSISSLGQNESPVPKTTSWLAVILSAILFGVLASLLMNIA